MKVKFIEPAHKFPIDDSVGLPLWLLYLTSSLRARLSDLLIEASSLRLKQVLRQKIVLAEEVDVADVVATTSITSNFDPAMEILKAAKERSATTVIGGIFASLNPHWVMKEYPFVDYLVRGDGELIFANLMQCIKENKQPRDVKGLSWRLNGQVIHNEDADIVDPDCLPDPAYDIVDMGLYREMGPGSIYTMRGCCWSCKFCSLSEFRKHQVAYTGVKNAIRQLQMSKLQGFSRVRIEDETATLNRSRALDLFRSIADAGLGMEL